MVVSSVVIAVSKLESWPFFTSKLSVLALVSPSHHVFCSWSCLASSSMSDFIFSISLKTLVNGFPMANRPAMRAKRVDFLSVAIDCKYFLAASRPDDCVTEESCTNAPVAPVLVAATFPKASKAWSLFRIAIAFEIAASSSARRDLRLSNSSTFSTHIVSSLARKASLSSFCCTASDNCCFFVEISPSLVPIMVCFSSNDNFIVSCSPFFVFMNLPWDSTAVFSVVRADSRLDSKVSFMLFKMPTTPPELPTYTPVKGAFSCTKDSTNLCSEGDKKVFAANKASLTVLCNLANDAPESYPAMNLLCAAET
mmetsp:Transcript_26788/g.75463  ORF Transcript_26788/g.75463 Transcript_26788/m.75463 type:complete len:310 (-) Transcript_26788:509-1438(-)